MKTSAAHRVIATCDKLKIARTPKKEEREKAVHLRRGWGHAHGWHGLLHNLRMRLSVGHPLALTEHCAPKGVCCARAGQSRGQERKTKGVNITGRL